MRKNILGSWGERSFFFQGAGSKDPPPPPGRASDLSAISTNYLSSDTESINF